MQATLLRQLSCISKAQGQIGGVGRHAHLSPHTISLAHVVLVSLGDHQITRIIRPHVQAGYDSLCQPSHVPYSPSNGVSVR